MARVGFSTRPPRLKAERVEMVFLLPEERVTLEVPEPEEEPEPEDEPEDEPEAVFPAALIAEATPDVSTEALTFTGMVTETEDIMARTVAMAEETAEVMPVALTERRGRRASTLVL